MNLKDLRKMVEKGNFVEGIYNYCDRWCERCSFASRCLLFAQDRSEGDEKFDLEDESFWKKFASVLSDTREIILEDARERGIEPEELLQAAAQEPEPLRLVPGDHPLSRSALEYAGTVKAWFEAAPGSTVSSFVEHEPADNVEEAVAVILWYQCQIGVKLTSALNSRLEEEEQDEELPGVQPHLDGCAKFALIGIDRSIDAWGIQLDHFSAEFKGIRSILLRLEALRRETEDAFAQARSFLRPGLDFLPTVQ